MGLEPLLDKKIRLKGDVCGSDFCSIIINELWRCPYLERWSPVMMSPFCSAMEDLIDRLLWGLIDDGATNIFFGFYLPNTWAGESKVYLRRHESKPCSSGFDCFVIEGPGIIMIINGHMWTFEAIELAFPASLQGSKREVNYSDRRKVPERWLF